MFETHPINGNAYLIGYGASLILSLALTTFLIKYLKSSHSISQFIQRTFLKSQNNSVNPLGGIAVILSFLLTLWGAYFLGALDSCNLYLLQVISIGIGLMFILGFVDDLVNTKPRVKLLAQIAIAIFLYWMGFKIEHIGDWLELGNFAFIVTVLWIVGITNSLNLIDGEDGLASGLVFLSCLTLVFVYLERNIFEAPFLAVILAGSIFGFLMFNFPPAKIILGDTGSLPLGLLISLVTLLPLSQGYTDEIYYLIPITTLILPITDTSFAFFRRVFKGISPFSKDAHHFHHRLGKLGLTPTRSIMILLSIAFYFDLLSLIPTFHINVIPRLIPIFFIFVLTNLIILIAILKRYEKKPLSKGIKLEFFPHDKRILEK